MDFSSVRTFTCPQVVPKKARASVRDKLVTLMCHVYVPTHKALFAGLSDGKLVVWKDRQTGAPSAKEDVPFEYTDHIGAIRCITYVEGIGSGLLFTGSSDRTIKVWDPWVGPTTKPCVQTLNGHGGSIISMAYAESYHILASSSTDNTICIWRPDEGRSLLLYPWFKIVQSIRGVPCKDRYTAGWVNAVSARGGESLAIYAGDSQGSLSIYRPQDLGRRKEISFELVKKNDKVHDLGISQVLLVASDNFLFTLGFDQTMRAFEATNGSEFFKVENQNRCMFTGVGWDSHQQELYLVDEMGYLAVWNVYMEKCLTHHQLSSRKLLGVTLVPQRQQLLVSTEEAIELFDIHRGVRFQEISGHEGPILSLLTISRRDTAVQTEDITRIISSSLDNTIRFWDPQDMACLALFREEMSEICSLTYLPSCHLLASGHDDGSIRVWNPETGSHIVLMRGSENVHRNSVSAMCAARFASREYLISGSYDGQLSFWDMSEQKKAGEKGGTVTPKLEMLFQAHRETEDEVLCMTYNPFSEILFTSGNGKDIYLWNIAMYTKEGQLTGHEDSVTCLALDGNYLFSGSEDQTIRVWETANKYHLYTLKSHTAPVTDLLVIPDTGYVVSCSFDATIVVWKYQKELVLKQFQHSEEFRCLAYLRNATTILAGTEQNNILFFPLDFRELEANQTEKLKKPPNPVALSKADSFRYPGFDDKTRPAPSTEDYTLSSDGASAEAPKDKDGRAVSFVSMHAPVSLTPSVAGSHRDVLSRPESEVPPEAHPTPSLLSVAKKFNLGEVPLLPKRKETTYERVLLDLPPSPRKDITSGSG
eukprot:GILK01005367.1.p1 GENE.GILK01005367.1~~GILK01005367.1.p1  ORF type:complete len:818 (+),score=111.10 GILK01005367.1:64-2517(+)